MKKIKYIPKIIKKQIRLILFFLNTLYVYYSLRRNEGVLKRKKLSRVLILSVYDIGDAVLSIPFLRELRRNLPQAHITLLSSAKAHNLLEITPYADKIITCDLLRRGSKGVNLFKLVGFVRKHFWGRDYDLAIALSWEMSFGLSLLAQLSVKPFRVIYNSYFLTKKKWLLKLLDWSMPRSLRSVDHEVGHNLDTLRYIGGEIKSDRLEVWIDLADRSQAEKHLSDLSARPDDLLVALCPGAYYLNHRWPIENYMALTEWLAEKYQNAKILVIGGKGEEALGAAICERLPQNSLSLIGRTTLRQTLAALQKCDIYIGNDTGPMHLAAAVGLPVIGITCHPATDQMEIGKYQVRFTPWQVLYETLRPERPKPPCVTRCKVVSAPHCITEVSLDDVKTAVTQFIESILNRPYNQV